MTLALLASPTSAVACDLDGLGGFHRFNPFGAGRGMNGLAPPPPPPPAEEKKAEKKQAEKEEPAKKANAKTTQEQANTKRSWETDEGNGPLSDEDKATFT